MVVVVGIVLVWSMMHFLFFCTDGVPAGCLNLGVLVVVASSLVAVSTEDLRHCNILLVGSDAVEGGLLDQT